MVDDEWTDLALSFDDIDVKLATVTSMDVRHSSDDKVFDVWLDALSLLRDARCPCEHAPPRSLVRVATRGLESAMRTSVSQTDVGQPLYPTGLI